MRRRLVWCAVALAVSACPAGAQAPSPARPAAPRSEAVRDWPIDRALARFSPAADSAWRISPAAGAAYADSLLQLAPGRVGRTQRAALHAWRGRKFADAYRLPEGRADLDTAWALSLALRDSAGLARVIAARGHGALVRGEHETARREFERLLPLARAAGLPAIVGFAHRGLGYVAKLNGRYDDAVRHLREAIRRLPPERFEHRHTRFLLAEVQNRLGSHDEARTMFIELLAEARFRSDRWLEAAVFNDLGILEFEEGDMAKADRYWAFAAGVFDSAGHVSAALGAGINRAHALAHLERDEEARVLLERIAADARRAGDAGSLHSALTELGVLYGRMGRPARAEALLRAVRAAEVEDARENVAASLNLGDVLLASGRPREAEALFDSMLAPGSPALRSNDDASSTRLGRSAARRALGRSAEALADARAAERLARAGRAAGSIYWLEAAVGLGRCHREAGRPDSAVAVLDGAARVWERRRAAISDMQWRERRGSKLAGLFAEYGLALLDARRAVPETRRARQAFDALQAFQGRTIEERMHGRGLAGRGVTGRVTADSLRRGVLRDGEALVDLLATPDTTIAFVITGDGVRAVLLRGTRHLDRLYADWREAALRGADEPTVRRGLGRLSDELLAPLAGALAGRRSVTVTGGGSLALWPLAALTVPGEDAPLGERREISTAPSATLLAALRARPARATGGVLAVGRTSDGSGRALPGAERELRSLAERYAGVELRLNRGERTVAELTRDLPRWDVLHFAAHAEAESGSPWRSGFLLGRGDGEDAYLRASGVAGQRLGARLAVLSGCQSAGAATLAGEGALGLASAFLSAGTRSVVATLWPVEDRVARHFMEAFYAALGRGLSVAGAVGAAQQALRARGDTAQTRDWAAFVTAGEGGTRIALAARRSGETRP